MDKTIELNLKLLCSTLTFILNLKDNTNSELARQLTLATVTEVKKGSIKLKRDKLRVKNIV